MLVKTCFYNRRGVVMQGFWLQVSRRGHEVFNRTFTTQRLGLQLYRVRRAQSTCHLSLCGVPSSHPVLQAARR